MIIQFKTFNSDHLLTTDVSTKEWAAAFNTGMLGTLRLKSMVIHAYEDGEEEELLWYSFENAKAGIPAFVAGGLEG